MKALSVAVVLALVGCGGCCAKKPAHLVPKERATAAQIRRSAEQVDSNAPQRRLETALFVVYRHARAVAGLSDPPPESPSVVEAARTIDELSPKLGDFWRMLAVVKLGAVGLDKAEFRQAIQILKVEPHKLDQLFGNRPIDFLALAFQPIDLLAKARARDPELGDLAVAKIIEIEHGANFLE